MLTQSNGPRGSGWKPQQPPGPGKAREPGWTEGLRKLYNSIVDEPLPDSFEDLLKKLDESGDD